MVKGYKSETLYFYTLFLLHLLTYRYSFLASLYIFISASYLIINYDVKYDKKNIIYIFIALAITSFAVSYGIHFREMALFIWFILLYLSFVSLKYPLSKMLTFLNVTYLIYLFLSVLVTFHYINGGFRVESEALNQFEVSYFNYSWVTLTGFSGTTAGIDSYAMLIFIINILYNSKYRKLMVLIAFSSIILTTRMTPWVMVFASMIYMLFRNSKFIGYAFVFGLFTSFLVPQLFIDNTEIQIILFAVSHGRNFVWNLYYDVFFGASWYEILLGIRSSKIPYVFLSEWSGYINAPHSTYFRILIANGFILYFMFYLFISDVVVRSSKLGWKPLFIIVAILIAAITNENIFHNHNPVYLLTLFYFSFGSYKTSENINA